MPLNILQVQHNHKRYTLLLSQSVKADIRGTDKCTEIVYRIIKPFKSTQRNKHVKQIIFRTTPFAGSRPSSQLQPNSQCTIDRIINSKADKKRGKVKIVFNYNKSYKCNIINFSTFSSYFYNISLVSFRCIYFYTSSKYNL